MEEWTIPEYSEFETALAAAPGTYLPQERGIFTEPKKLAGMAVECRELMMLYACALKEMQTRFEILSTEFSAVHRRNPISSIQTRLKGAASIVDKLNRKGIPFSPGNMTEHLDDIAGVRVICQYVDDIFFLADAIAKQKGIVVLRQKDYITHPKPNGYRSFHMILEVPISFSAQERNVKVEVQIRTIAMDFWASLEHQLKYKQKNMTGQTSLIERLRACAEVIAATDEEMMQIRSRIDAAQSCTEDEFLLEKLRKIDRPLDK